MPPSATCDLQLNVSRLLGRGAELGVQFRPLLAAGWALCCGSPLSVPCRCIPKAAAGVEEQDGCAGWAAVPTQGQDAPAATGSAQMQDSPEAQPSRAQGRAGGSSCTSHQHREVPVAVPSCPTQPRAARGAGIGVSQRSRGMLPAPEVLFPRPGWWGHAQGLQTQLSLPTPAPGAGRGWALAATGAQKMTRSSCVLSHHRLLFRVPKVLSSSSCSLASSTNTWKTWKRPPQAPCRIFLGHKHNSC